MRTAFALGLLMIPMMITTPAQIQLAPSVQLETVVKKAVESALEEFADRELKPDELAVTLVDLENPEHPLAGSYRGDIRIYPASVVKLFYLGAAHRWMEDGKILDTEELRRAMRDMIVDSSNEATHYIVDLLTETTSGPELPPAEMAEWENKRNTVNRYFASRGFANINVNQKPWCEGPYGRERAFVGREYTNRNMLTTDATARLLTEIVTGQAVNKERSGQMLELMKRDPFSPTTDADDQAHGFTGPAVPPGAQLWSKAGWTSQTRHDAACLELPSGRKLVVVIFTVNHAKERGIIPAIAREILKTYQ